MKIAVNGRCFDVIGPESRRGAFESGFAGIGALETPGSAMLDAGGARTNG
jgi:hypothetical protein